MGGGDPLAECQSFNELLAATSGALDALLPALRAQEEALATLDSDLRDELRGLDGDADALEHGISEGGAPVTAAARDLEQHATEAHEAAAAVETAADQAKEAAGRDLDQVGDRIQSGFEELLGEPFALLKQGLQQEQAEFTQAAADMQEAMGPLSGAFETSGHVVVGDLEETRKSFEDAEDGLEQARDLVVMTSVDGVEVGQILLSVFPDSVEPDLKRHTEALDNALEDWERRLDTEAAALQSSIASLVENAVAALGASAGTLQAATMALAKEWEGAQAEAAQTVADLASATPALTTAVEQASLIGDIQWRILWVHQVIDAMDTK